MKTTFGAIAVALALIAGAGAVSAMPNTGGTPFDFETVFEPRN